MSEVSYLVIWYTIIMILLLYLTGTVVGMYSKDVMQECDEAIGTSELLMIFSKEEVFKEE